MDQMVSSAIEELKKLDKEIMALTQTMAILGWDQETYMPTLAVEGRADQLALLGKIHHEKVTNPRIGELLEKTGSTDSNPLGEKSIPQRDRALLRALHRQYSRATKLPTRLVTELAKAASLAQAVWVQARQDNDFKTFSPYLTKLIDLRKEQAGLFGYEDHPYDALLDEFEPWVKSAAIKPVFDNLRDYLSNLVKEISEKPEINNNFLKKTFPIEKQRQLSVQLLTDMNYDFNRGRLDETAHPFTTTLGRDDVRITTRYQRQWLKSGLFGTIHEAGHGLYELGFDSDLKGSILGEGASLGIHESQSRFWENCIGHSLPFWKHYYPALKEYFPHAFEGVSLDEFYKGLNKVTPSLIRVEADEVTYSLHIILRFELELGLIEGSISTDDLPELWRTKSEEYLGIRPKTDADGVLQDIHWSMGAFGYFPTYALGNLYSAQFLNALKKELPEYEKKVEQGDLTEVLTWLRQNIHNHGSIHSADELCRKVTGESLKAHYFTDYLDKKYRSIYDL